MSDRRWRHWGLYAAAAFPLTVVQVPLYVYVPKFYTDVVGLPIALIGAILLGGRLFDAVTDPLVGELSDRTRTRWGRRRPWVGLGGIGLGLGVIAVFAPPAGAGGLWAAAALALVFLFWTAVVVPYEALGVEITDTYDQRTLVLGLRDGLALVGTLAAVITPVALAAALGLADDIAGERTRFFWFAMIYGPLVALACGAVAWGVPEPPLPDPEPGPPWHERLRALLHNRPFVILITSYTVGGLGANIPSATLLFFVEYVIGSEHTDLFLLLYIVTGIVCVPLWLWAARRFEKRSAWIAALALTGTSQLGVAFLGPGDEVPYAALTVFSGIAFGGMLTLPMAMLADVIDAGELGTGRREQGLYVGVWNVARKFAGAVGVGTALWVLGAAGYEANAEQSEGVRTTLRILYALVPAVFTGLGALLLWPYPVDRAAHAAIRAGLESPRDIQRIPEG